MLELIATILTIATYLAYRVGNRVGNLTSCIKQFEKWLDPIDEWLTHIETCAEEIIERLTRE